MPGSEDLQAFVEEALLEFDPDIDLSDGSPAQVEVIDPIVNRFTPDPFEVDVQTFIRTRIHQEYPLLSAEEGDALADLLIKPMEALLDPIIREVEFLRKNKSLNDPGLLSPDEADALMGNFFVSRTRGDISVGTVRIYFNAPTGLSLSLSNETATSDGLKFIPAITQEISAEDMLFNQDGNLFYMDAAYEAETEGDEYNIDIGDITTIANIPAAVRVTNLARFRDGAPEESTLQFIERGESSLTERSLVVPRGVIARLFSQFADLEHLQVVGFNDPEMSRDIIKGGNLGEIVIYATDGQTSDDGDGDGFTNLFQSPSGGFITNLGSVGENVSHVLTVAGSDYDISEVVSDDIVKVTAVGGDVSELSDILTSEAFYIRKRFLTLSDIPGGIINPDGPNGTVDIVNDEIHVGGSSDFHVRGTTLDEEELVIEAVSDEEPLMTGTGMETLVVGLPSDVVIDPTLVGTFAFLGVKVGMTLVIETDVGNAGSYQILNADAAGVGGLQVEPPPGSIAGNQKYEIVNEIDINLNEPKTIRGFGSDLKTILGSTQVSTVSEVDFDQLGTEEDDILRIPEPSLNAGDYTVSDITGTGNKILDLGAQLKKTSSSESWSLFKLGAGIDTPLIRVTSVELLDSSKQPTGDTIPFADPVDIQTRSFSNIGVGEKKTVTDGVLGILGTVDLTASPTAVNGKTVRIGINNTFLNITFSGVVVAADIVTQINTGWPGYNIASLYDVEGESRLSLRSRNNWIQVAASGSANAALGFSITYQEDNRQVVSSSVTDWTVESLGIEAEKDSVYVLTGDNIEFWYLHDVESDRLLISRVDENGKAVFPLTDDRVIVRIGSRSFGTVRCYFLEPTSFEVRGAYHRAATKADITSPNQIYGGVFSTDEEARTEFDYDIFGDESAYYRFFPDPALEHTILPVTDEDVPDNLYIATLGDTFVESDKTPPTGPGDQSRSDEIDFLFREAAPGDILEVTYHPLQGGIDIRPAPTGGPTYATEVQGKTMIFSLENGPDKTVTFSSSVDGPTKLVAEINAQLGVTIAYAETQTTGEINLRLEADFDFILRTTGTVMTPNDILGMQSVAGTNDAPAKGEYVISAVGYISAGTSNHMRLTVSSKVDEPSWTSFVTAELGPSQHFKIHRPGVQRISSTDMEQNVEGSLYYADIELVSFGPGNEFNIGPDLQLLARGYKSDGYRLYNSDNDLTFSVEELLTMQIGRRFLTPGSTDSPENMTLVSQQNIQINYERSSLVEEVQAFATSDLERVLCANLLVRHLVPHFVQFELNWQGGSKVSVVEEDIEDYVAALLPDDELEASAIGEFPRRRGASRVEMPITLLGIVHDTDRTVRIDRSQDAISRGRLATFITDDLTLVRDEDT